jgi:type IV pilus assembly protein PilQ
MRSNLTPAWLLIVVMGALDATALAEQPGQEPAAPSTTQVEVTDRGKVEMHVANLPLATVLQLLSLEGQRNIIASPNVKGTVTAHLYGVGFEDALQAILVQNDAGYRQVGNFIYVHTNAELAQIKAAASQEDITKVISLNYISAADAKAYADPIVGKDGSVVVSVAPQTGVASDPVNAGGQGNVMNDFVIVTARAEIVREVERILREIDVRPRQVLIEATILRAELSADNNLGIDFTIVGGVDLELMGSTSNAIQNINVGDLPTTRFEQMNAAVSTDFASNVPDGGITFGVIKDQVAVFLRALEQVTDTTVLANPKVLALNKQKGQVIVGRRDGFLTTTVTETQAVQTVEFLETGTQLIFRPFIGDDGFVRVELHPEDSVGFVNAQGLPSEQTTEVTTNVIVRDGETILIGGLFREVTTDAKSQVPGLGSIPGVGQLFRSNNDSTGREEVIILLTIHVVKDHGKYAEASKEVYEDIERMRVGMRHGLMWHGRERLSQAHYQKALRSLDCGDRDHALWHVNLAIHTFPRNFPAIQLKESILAERAADEDTAITRTFLQRLLAQEKDAAFVPFDRPEPPNVASPLNKGG